MGGNLKAHGMGRFVGDSFLFVFKNCSLLLPILYPSTHNNLISAEHCKCLYHGRDFEGCVVANSLLESVKQQQAERLSSAVI